VSLIPGFLVIDKAPGATSHDIVAMVRAVTAVRKVGHTGTLDPFAKGVLPLALGPATKLIRFLDESQKVYDATIALGSATDTGDPTGEQIAEAAVPDLDPQGVERVLDSFLGDRMQAPHRYSAVKVDGRRLYEYARRGQDVRAEPRPIHVYGLDLISLEEDRLRVLLTCSRGTYARGLADEIAQALGTVGHLCELTRTRSGPFSLAQSVSLPQLSEVVANTPDWQRALCKRRGAERLPWNPRDAVVEALLPYKLRPIDALPQLPLLPVSRGQEELVLRGGAAPPPPAGVRPGERYLVVRDDELAALAESQGGGRAAVLWRAAGGRR